MNEQQRKIYSGKKQCHTRKTQVVTDERGELLDLDAGPRGPKADSTLYEESEVPEPDPNAAKVGDQAYHSGDHPELITPHKNPKGGALTPAQREENRTIAQQRIAVEHGIRRIKAWRILRQDYRLALGLFSMIAEVVVGLVQLGRLLG